MSAPTKNIPWEKVPLTAHVELAGRPGSQSYVVNGQAVAYWSGKDTRRAQEYLDTLAFRTKLGIARRPRPRGVALH